MNISYRSTIQGRQALVEQLSQRRQQGPYRVIDIGGQAASWTRSVIDDLVDIRQGSEPDLTFDICSREAWQPLLDLVQKQGPWDFAICTHTLEDVYNPCTSLDLLPQIARAGVITTPSLRQELSRSENQAYLGCIHHRWLFDHEDGHILLAPKLGFLESRTNPIDSRSDCEEIAYEWCATLPWRMISNNLFESPQQMHRLYTDMIERRPELWR